METINKEKCLFDKGTRCYALNKKDCKKCSFYIQDTEENRTKYIKNLKEDIKNYAQNYK